MIHPKQQRKLSEPLKNAKIVDVKTLAPLSTSPTIKNVTKPSLATTATTTQNKKLTNVCIVRPQLQQQSQLINSYSSFEEEFKSISPVLHTPTSSLWQTPMLIEAPTMFVPISPTTVLQPGGIVAGRSVGRGSHLISSTTTTAMAKVAPILVHSPTFPTNPLKPKVSCLPPSNFHNHTLAQHLQKVECLKKPKKSVLPMAASLSTTVTSDTQCREVVKGNFVQEGLIESVQHSDSEELNEIPVNVIFRTSPKKQLLHPNDKISKKEYIASTPTSNDLISPQTKSDISVTSIPASRENNVSVDQLESNATAKQLHSYKTKLIAKKTQMDANQAEVENSELQRNVKPTETLEETAKSKASNIKSPTCNTNKTTSKKSSSFSSALSNPYSFSSDILTGKSSKNTVAVVNVFHHGMSSLSWDISDFATPVAMPYCLQNYWFKTYDYPKPLVATGGKTLNRSSVREENIALYKQQLRRQAMQMLSTRSLQRLPLHVARRRLVCVDSLLWKHKQNKKGLPVSIKRCCVDGCEAFSLELSSHCQKHIVLSAGNEIFLPCTAKFADNTQCRVPVFDITHDFPLCLEHARKRDTYNRLVYEHKPRKIYAKSAGIQYTSESIGVPIMLKQEQIIPAVGNKRTTIVIPNQQEARKRKVIEIPVVRPVKRMKKVVTQMQQTVTTSGLTAKTVSEMTRLPITGGLKRKGSTTSLESIASNSQHSTTSSTAQLQQHQEFIDMPNSLTPFLTNSGLKTLPTPALVPLNSRLMSNHSLPPHLFSFGHDNLCNVNKHTSDVHSPTIELNNFVTNLNVGSTKTLFSTSASYSSLESTESHLVNCNSNSNFTSSGMDSTTSRLTAADDFLNQDSSISSVDTGLGGLSDAELMLGGQDGDELPLLEEHDLANVLNLPEDAYKELFATVHQNDKDEIERAIEFADKHLKTLQQTISTELGGFPDFASDMLMDNSDMCDVDDASNGCIGIALVGDTSIV